MKTIIADMLALIAASAPSLAESQSAAEFALKTCLSAMDDLGKIEVMARENNWIALPPTPVRPGPRFVEHGPNWKANGFFVHTWVLLDGNLPNCFVGLHGANVNRDEFFQAISASVELKLPSRVTVKSQLRMEQYEIYEINMGPTKLELCMVSMADGIMSSTRISKTTTSLPYYGLPDR
jgi:hypothetical protein